MRNILPEEYGKGAKSFFASKEEFLKVRDELFEKSKSTIEELNNKQAKSWETLSNKFYR